MSCTGDGSCLLENRRSGIYKPNILCKHNCLPINCPNHMVCYRNYPQHYKETYGDLCLTCDMLFGTWQNGRGILPTIDNAECPICLETTLCISQPKCEHYVCIDCFQRCYYGKLLDRPDFPHPDLENEYLADEDNIKWIINYPRIHCYEQLLKLILIREDQLYMEEAYLRRCPLCRK